MRYAYPPYDFIIVACLTFFAGYVLRKTLFKNKEPDKKYMVVPYAIAFIFVSIGFVLITGELPLKVYPYDDYVYDPDDFSGPNPQSSPEGMKNFFLYILSAFINLALLAYALFLLIRYLLILRRKRPVN